MQAENSRLGSFCRSSSRPLEKPPWNVHQTPRSRAAHETNSVLPKTAAFRSCQRSDQARQLHSWSESLFTSPKLVKGRKLLPQEEKMAKFGNHCGTTDNDSWSNPEFFQPISEIAGTLRCQHQRSSPQVCDMKGVVSFLRCLRYLLVHKQKAQKILRADNGAGCRRKAELDIGVLQLMHPTNGVLERRKKNNDPVKG